MAYKLLFITSQYFYPFTLEALERIAPDCETKVVAYDSFSDISSLYDQYADWLDACLVSGVIARGIIERNHDTISKPLSHFQVSSDGLHRSILRLAVQQQSLDFSRLALDFLLPHDNRFSVEDYLSYEDPSILISQTFDKLKRKGVDPVSTEDYLMDRIRQLYQNHTIDLVVCQYSSLIPRLEAEGIPFFCPFISDENLRKVIEELLIRLELRQLQNQHPAIIQVFPRQNHPLRAEQHRLLYKCTQQFFQSNMIECLIQNSKNCCTVITTVQILQYLTHDYQKCQLSSYLNSKLEFPIAVGYGIGTTINHAMNNVQTASREAKLTGNSFIMDGSGNLIGPLNSDGRMILEPVQMGDVSLIAKRCSLSAMTVKKIITILQATGTDKMTIPDLAARMGTTVRNANRIMLNLCKGNVAAPIYTQLSHSRGRPLQVYALNFDKNPD